MQGLPPLALSWDYRMFGRVEDGRGSLGHLGIAPFPVPAHQTGRAGLPHPAFRLVSPRGTRQGVKMNPAQPKHAEIAEHHPIGVAPGAARRHLVTPDQEVADPVVDVVVDRPVGREPRAVAEVRGPTADQAVQAIAHLVPRSRVAGNQEVADLAREPEHALLRRARPEVPGAILAIAVRAERVAEEVEALASSV